MNFENIKVPPTISYKYFFLYFYMDLLTCNIEWKVYWMHKFKEEHILGDQYITSHQVSHPKCPSIVWEMRVYPNKRATSRGSFASLLQKGPINNKIKAKYNIYATDSDHEMRVDVTTHEFNFTKKENESHNYSIDFANAYYEDYFFLCCDVVFLPENIIDYSEIINTPQKNFHNMYMQGILTDCVIKAFANYISSNRTAFLKSNEWKYFKKLYKDKAFNLLELAFENMLI
ncbi:BTB domain-containing protein [Meloidogyne graminicola]|uniref:BTB domain-containing protein n=1 Tax=Meloidogyne graminicola TaxID=189291 RepID=A0A8S9ZTC0_9BILA|nr:BTB domain-containing protein [Meloidogyne graminicola]